MIADQAVQEFHRFGDESLAPLLRIQAAKKSISLFGQAEREARSRDERIAAVKNSASVASRLAAMPAFHERSEPELVHYYFEYAMKRFLAALKAGRDARKPSEWIERVESLVDDVAKSMRRYLVDATGSWKVRAGKLQRLSMSLSSDELSDDVDASLACANVLMLEAREMLNGAAKFLSPPLGSWVTPPRLAEMQALVELNNCDCSQPARHSVSCSDCGKANIVGARYKCATRPVFDLCQRCHSKVNIKERPFIIIETPQSDHSIAAIDKLRVKFETEEADAGWMPALSALADASRPIAEVSFISSRCVRSSRTPPSARVAEISSKAAEAEEERGQMERRARCLQLIAEAESAKSELLGGNDEICMDEAWRIADILTAAIRTAQGTEEGDSSKIAGCLEEEAIATARLGELYHRILKNNDNRAQRLLLQSIQLAAAHTQLDGRSFFSVDWYVKAKIALEELRKRREAYDMEELRKRRAPILEKLKSQLDAIKSQKAKSAARRTQALHLLRHLVKAHPPKKPSVAKAFESKVGELDPDADSKAFTEALLRILTREAAMAYHADKNKEYGMEWAVLAEEIMKHINAAATDLKGL